MPIMQCSNCGHVSNYKSTSQCLQCAAIINIPVKPKRVVSKTQKVIFSMVFGVLILGVAGYGAMYFISWQQEQARIELEKKQLDEFDTINFKADSDSVANAVKSLPVQFKFQQPPNADAVKQNLNESESTKQKSETKTRNKTVKFKTPGKSEYNCVSGSTIGRVGSATMTTGGCGNYSMPSTEFSSNISVTNTTLTSYKVIGFQAIQYDYVKGSENRLVCFVTYQASIGKFNRISEGSPEFSYRDKPSSKKDIGSKASEYDVKESARYDLENGNWVFKEAGLSEFEKTLSIDKVRIEATNKAQQ